MTIQISRYRRSMALIAGVAMALTLSPAVLAQDTGANPASDQRIERRERSDRRSSRASKEAQQRYPLATRESPGLKTSGRTGKKLQEMVDLQAEGKSAEAGAIAASLLASEDTSNYEKALAAQTAAQVAYDAGDTARALEMFERIVALDALDNNNHYAMMLNLAQLQQQQKQYEQSLATYDRFLRETGGGDAEALMMKGQTLFLMDRNEEAAAVMQQAIDASDDPKPEWKALLMQAHARSGNADEAVRMAEQVAAAKPDDRRAQLNLAAVYQQAGMQDKSLAVLEKLRTGGQLTEAVEYQQLYTTYINMEGKEAEAIAVINEGVDKGILAEDFNTSVALAQAYYFSGQIAPAIEAYRKAAPLDDDGSTYLNLAKVLLNEGRDAEAGEAAGRALEKGVPDPEEARGIIKAASD